MLASSRGTQTARQPHISALLCGAWLAASSCDFTKQREEKWGLVFATPAPAGCAEKTYSVGESLAVPGIQARLRSNVPKQLAGLGAAGVGAAWRFLTGMSSPAHSQPMTP